MRRLRPFLFLIAIVKFKTSLEETIGPAPIFTCFPTCLYCSPVETLGKILSILKSGEIFTSLGQGFHSGTELFKKKWEMKKAWSQQAKHKRREICLQQCFYMHLFVIFVWGFCVGFFFLFCFNKVVFLILTPAHVWNTMSYI